jgi:hypothetical protein
MVLHSLFACCDDDIINQLVPLLVVDRGNALLSARRLVNSNQNAEEQRLPGQRANWRQCHPLGDEDDECAPSIDNNRKGSFLESNLHG